MIIAGRTAVVGSRRAPVHAAQSHLLASRGEVLIPLAIGRNSAVMREQRGAGSKLQRPWEAMLPAVIWLLLAKLILLSAPTLVRAGLLRHIGALNLLLVSVALPRGN